jgi:long-chain acyl-CoA synthetase
MTYDDKPWLSSYDPGVSESFRIPSGKTFVDYLEEGFGNDPNAPALFYMGRTIRFRELDELGLRFADFLAKSGYGPGDVVAVHLPNLPQYLIALTGTLRAGLASSGVSILLTPKELRHQLNDCGAKVLVTLDLFFKEKLAPVHEEIPKLEKVVVAGVGDYLPPVKRILGGLLGKIPKGPVFDLPKKSVMPFTGVMAQHKAKNPNVAITGESAGLIQYTGGTTGLPKGVVLTHANLVSNIEQIKSWAEFKLGGEVFCSGFPFFHQAGQYFGMVAMATGNAQCLIPDPRNTDHITNEIRTHRATAMANVPTLYHMLLDNPKFRSLDFSAVKILISGAAPFSAEGIGEMEKVVGKGRVLEVYGMTETTPIITANPYLGKKKTGSVGLPVPGTLVKIVDVESGTREMPFGEEGELIVSGPQVMARYHNKPGETEHAVRSVFGGRWLYTGDVARMDEEGFVYIVDRAKDMLNVGGFKVFSREVEEVLYKHPAVAFCAIVGEKNPDRPGSEVVKAVIQLNAQASAGDRDALSEDIRNHCRENMAPYKVPKKIEFVEAIPLTAVGKVDKKALRKPLA